MAMTSFDDKRATTRTQINNGNAFIDGNVYTIHDLSHGGFAVSGNLTDKDPDKVFDIIFKLASTNRQLEVRCKTIKMWDNDEMSGFEFYKPSKQQLIDINNYLRALDTVN